MEIKRYGAKEFLAAGKLCIRENEIHIWCICWPEMTDFWVNHEYILSGQESEQVGRFRFSEDRMRYIAGKVVVRLLLKRYLDVETIDFSVSERGLNPHSFVNLPAEEQEKLLKEYGSQKAAEKALEEKYGEMARHPIVKMSKSLGNVINPDEVVDQYGADTMRLYEMFMGDFEQAAPWQTSAIAGCNRFLDRVWALSDKLVEGEGYRPQLETLLHQTIKKVGADIEGLKMNTAIAQLMTLVNALYDNGGATRAEFETVVQLLNPFAPHMTEELWEKLGHSHDEQLAYYPWPKYEEAKCVESTVEIAVQVNGKVKARLKVAADITSEDAIAAAKADPAVAEALSGKTVVKEIYVKGRLVNLAVKG